MRYASLFLALAAMPAMAELAPLHLDSAQTSQGLARVEGDRLTDGQRLIVGDRVAYEVAPGIWLDLAAQKGDLLLLAVGDGGNVCAAQFVWVNAADSAFGATDRFGSCSDEIEVTHDAETVTVTMWGPGPGEQVSYVYDGRVVTDNADPMPGWEGPTPDLADWIGTDPRELVMGYDYGMGFLDLVGEAGYEMLLLRLEQSSTLERDADDPTWLVAFGTSPLNGEAGVGLHKSGVIAVVQRDVDGNPTVAVSSDIALPPSLRMMGWAD